MYNSGVNKGVNQSFAVDNTANRIQIENHKTNLSVIED